MNEPIESVACVASTPAQAKVFVATLMAGGIPARIEGDNLTDEWAASRRLLNLLGTRVMVPTKSLAQAREMLRPAAIDADELERQALAAAGEEAPPLVELESFAQRSAAGGVPWLIALAVAAAIVAALAFG